MEQYNNDLIGQYNNDLIGQYNNDLMEENDINVETIIENKQFTKEYNCFPLSYLEAQGIKTKDDIKNLEKSDRIIMPPSALNHLMLFKINYPYFFKLTSRELGISEYCGVLEFTAPEKTIYAPSWLMHKLFIDDRVYINSVNLPCGKRVKFKAVPEFFALPNQQVILEKTLRELNVLSMGQELNISFVGKVYKLTVVELVPCTVVSIINADLNVEFEPISEEESKKLPSFKHHVPTPTPTPTSIPHRILQKGTNDNFDQHHVSSSSQFSANNYVNKHTQAFSARPFGGIGRNLKSEPTEKKIPFKNKIHGINSPATNKDDANDTNNANSPSKKLTWGKGNRLGDS